MIKFARNPPLARAALGQGTVPASRREGASGTISSMMDIETIIVATRKASYAE
jgi:hypothetical protein